MPRTLVRRHPFIVVSGLPASGKTTIATLLASTFGLPFYDKDDILEALFDTIGSADHAARRQLSRASDRVLETLVGQSHGAVLTSFWRSPGDEGTSGTPSEWLRRLSPSVIEVHCKCPPEAAVRRFLSRSRHPGHHDANRSEEELLAQFRNAAERGPLGVGKLIIFDTSTQGDAEPLVREIRLAFERHAGRVEQ